jgi:hypothetical protein
MPANLACTKPKTQSALQAILAGGLFDIKHGEKREY